jgi:C4-dicarboxylate-specific signal transduction histidine kinase
VVATSVAVGGLNSLVGAPLAMVLAGSAGCAFLGVLSVRLVSAFREPAQRTHRCLLQTLESRHFLKRRGRLSVAGLMTASIAHEINNPLTNAWIHQVVVTLLRNSAEAITAGGMPIGDGLVEVRTHGQDGYVVLEVADKGPGIPATKRQGLFTPFGPHQGSQDARGMGLPLAPSVRAAEGGTLETEPWA